MPTRLGVLLHRRKSAAAGPVDEMVSASAANALANSAPPNLFVAMTRLIQTQIRFQSAGLSTRMARKSVTLVNVGPGTNRSPIALKNPVESLSARNEAGSRPRPLGPFKVGSVINA